MLRNTTASATENTEGPGFIENEAEFVLESEFDLQEDVSTGHSLLGLEKKHTILGKSAMSP